MNAEQVCAHDTEGSRLTCRDGRRLQMGLDIYTVLYNWKFLSSKIFANFLLRENFVHIIFAPERCGLILIINFVNNCVKF